MKRIFSKIFVTAWCMTAGLAAFADPIAIAEGEFTASATLVDFDAIGNGQSINDQFATSNVVFSGALFGLRNPGDTSLFDGSTIASNWIYWPGTGNQGLAWEATFGTLITSIGFLAETNRADSVTIEAFAGAASLGFLNFANPNGVTPDFLGLSDASGFNRIVVTTDNNHNGFFAMDDFRFGGSVSGVTGSGPGTPVAVPEPASFLLVAVGLLGLGFRRRSSHAHGAGVGVRTAP